MNSSRLQLHETKLAGLVDELWHISDTDHKRFQARNPGVRTLQRVVPPTFDEGLFRSRAQAFERLSGTGKPVVGFIGHLDFAPNAQSVSWILDEVAPLLKSRNFSGEILIGGRNPPSFLVEKARPFTFVRFLGFVEDIETFLARLDLTLVPHIDGSGVRIKLLESIASGIPVLANAAAVDRISDGLRSSPLLAVSDDPSDWAERILKIRHRVEREKYLGLGIHPSLRGESVYAFLKSEVGLS